MADEAIRSAARSFRASGDAADLARLVLAGARAGTLPAGAADLAERLAAGAVTFDDVELAALLGDPLARAIAGEALAERCAYQGHDRAFDIGVAEGPIGWELLEEWFLVVASFGRRALALVLLGVLEPLREAVREREPTLFGDGYEAFFVEMHRRDQEFALGDLDLIERAIEAWLAGEGGADVERLIEQGRDRYRTTEFLDDVVSVASDVGALALGDADPAKRIGRWGREAANIVPPARLVAAIRTRIAPRLLGGASLRNATRRPG